MSTRALRALWAIVVLEVGIAAAVLEQPRVAIVMGLLGLWLMPPARRA